jgi:serine/threonine-protein kinase
MARMIAPQCKTSPTGEAAITTGCFLPPALMAEQVRRVGICAAVGAALWAYGLAMDGAIRPLTLGTPVPLKNVLIEAASILFSALMLLYVRVSRQDARTKVFASLVYLVLNAAAVSLLNNWTNRPVVAISGLLSWNTVVILVGAMIIPASPGWMLAASLVAATTDPLSVWFSHLRGASVPSPIDTFVLFMPNYACAAVAVLPSRVLQRLGRTLKQAQEMGSYRLEELLGRGGMGEVWRATHRLLARDAAVKLVRPELIGAVTIAEAEAMVRRFRREAQATANLASPHTIRLYDFGFTEDRTFYYVMELLSGRDLEALVRSAGPLPAERVIFLLRQIGHSLAEAHAKGLVHRDITPANIYVCRMGLDYDFVKVLDFGLVSYSDPRSAGQSLITGRHTTSGTPAFMAPEVIVEGAVDARADIYALGCVAYYLLTGELVFTAETPMKMFIEHLNTPPVPPSVRGEMPIPVELEAIVLACLEKEPAQRIQSIDELLRRLDQIPLKSPWTNAAARDWWDQHFVDLAAPVTPDSPDHGGTEPSELKTTLLFA